MTRVRPNSSLSTLAAILLSSALSVALVPASPAQSVVSGVPVTNGSVQALAVAGDILYLGGTFTQVGDYTGAGAITDGATGALVPPSPAFTSATFPPGGVVYAVCDDGAGGWFVGGIFSSVGGQARQNLVHLLADGTVSPWNPGANAPVRALLRSGSTLFVGGDFSMLGGQPRASLGAVDAASGSALALNPGTDGVVFALALSGTTLHAGGSFSQLAGQPRARIGAVDTGTGAATAWAPVVAGAWVRTIALGATSVFLGGGFTTVNGQARANVAAVDIATGANRTWKPDASGEVRALVLSGSDVFAAGEFTSIGGRSRIGVAKLNSTNGNADAAWNAGSDDYVFDLRLDGSTLLAAGAFTTIGGQPRLRAAAIALSNGAAGAWNPRVNGHVESVARSGSRIMLGGSFTLADPLDRTGLAALDLNTLRFTAWDPGIAGGGMPQVRALATDGTALYVGGSFGTAQGAARNGLAAYQVASGALLPWAPALNQGGAIVPEVHALLLEPGVLRVGGQFEDVGGVPRSHAAALDPASGALLAWAPEPNQIVRAMAPSAGGLFMAGGFSTVGGTPRALLAQVDPVTGVATAWAPPPFAGMFRSNGVYENPTLLALACEGSTLYVGGAFSGAGGQPRPNAVALDALTGSVNGWTAPGSMLTQGPPYGVYAFDLAGPSVLLGTVHPFLSGLLALDAATGAAASWPPSVSRVRALARWGALLVLGGDFQSIAGQIAGGLALVNDPGVLDVPSGAPLAGSIALSSPVPQPARGGARVTLSLARASRVSVSVFDLTGRLERTLMQEAAMPAGRHSIALELTGLPPGIHWVSARAGGRRPGRAWWW